MGKKFLKIIRKSEIMTCEVCGMVLPKNGLTIQGNVTSSPNSI